MVPSLFLSSSNGAGATPGVLSHLSPPASSTRRVTQLSPPSGEATREDSHTAGQSWDQPLLLTCGRSCGKHGAREPPEPGATMAGHGRAHGQGDVPLDAAAREHVAPGLSPGEVTVLWEAVVPVHVATRAHGGGHELCVAVVPTHMATRGHSLQPQGDHKPPGSSLVTSLWAAPCGKTWWVLRKRGHLWSRKDW